MDRCGWLLGVALLFGMAAGCGSSGDSPRGESAANEDDGASQAEAKTAKKARKKRSDVPAPERVVNDFLQAIREGDETKANDLLTPLAREKTAEAKMAVAPTGTETAQFEVGEVEFPKEGNGAIAHVLARWTDVGDDGQPHTDDILWVLRREDEGWRIGGMATKVFDDEPPLLLDFEDPADMLRKQQLAEAEMERRARAAASQDVAEDEAATEDPGEIAPTEERQVRRPEGSPAKRRTR
jgi:ketosteroid isomerase-like protein